MDDYIISFYNEKKEKKSFPINNYINAGEYGNIYKLDRNRCLKLFSDKFFFNDEVLKIIKKLKPENFYKIYDLLYDKDNHFCGYTMKYYQNKDVDITKMPTSYLLDNLYKLRNAFKLLSDNNILANDCCKENIIMDDKNITIIDADFFYLTDDNNNINYRILLNLFRELCHESLKMYDYDNYDIDNATEYLFDNHKDIKEVEKKLVRYKYPIDYFNDFMEGRTPYV